MDAHPSGVDAIIVAGVAGAAWPDDASSVLRGVGLVIAIGGQVLFIRGFEPGSVAR